MFYTHSTSTAIIIRVNVMRVHEEMLIINVHKERLIIHALMERLTLYQEFALFLHKIRYCLISFQFRRKIHDFYICGP